MSNDEPQWREPTEEEERVAPRVNGFTFWDAFGAAVGVMDPGAKGSGGDVGPLADYIASDAPLTTNDRLMLAGLLRLIPAKMPPGNPNIAPNVEVREAARRVYEAQECWRQQYNKPHVPSTTTDGFIDTEIKRIADQRGVAIPTDSGEHANLAESILNALNHKRF